jgi:hypothetical protein
MVFSMNTIILPFQLLQYTSEPESDLPPLGHAREINSAILAPSMEFHLQSETIKTTDELSEGHIEILKLPEIRYYFYGWGVYYEDLTLRKVHRFEYCMYSTYGKKPGEFTPCFGKRYKNTTD